MRTRADAREEELFVVKLLIGISAGVGLIAFLYRNPMMNAITRFLRTLPDPIWVMGNFVLCLVTLVLSFIAGCLAVMLFEKISAKSGRVQQYGGS